MFHIDDSTKPPATFPSSARLGPLELTEEERDELCDAEMKYRYRKDDPGAFGRYWVRTVERILARRSILSVYGRTET